MEQNTEPLLSKSRADQSELTPGRSTWIACVALLFLSGGVLLWLLDNVGLSSWTTAVELGSIYMLTFHAVTAALATLVLTLHYADKVPMTARYQVPGEASIPMVQYDFVHSGRWTTFTTWCNTVAACYFWLVTVACILLIQDGAQALPKMLVLALGVLWDISLPMGFLVNLIVSFVLLPTKKKNGDFVGLWYMLKWRGQMLHNGYVLAVSFEAAVVSPKIPLSSFPVIALYGILYVIFSYLVFSRTGVFHYFFLDPRWKLAPLGLVGLLGLLIVLFFAGSVATNAAASSWLAKCLVIVAALATCTFRDGAAVAPASPTSSAAA